MGCGQSTTKDEKNTKQFHELSEEEKEKRKKQMEEQDKDLKEEVNENEDPSVYEKYDWDKLIQKLPTEKTAQERKKRLALWNQLNEYGNGYLSYKRLSVQLDKYLELPNAVKSKGPIKLAFKSDANFSSMTKSQAIYISRIIHSSYIKVDEKGTEASAVTAVVGTRGGRPHQCLERSIIMDINHPFLFIIRNKDLPPGHDILFISKVENLNRDESKKSQNINTKEKERKKIDFSKLEYVNISFKRPVKWYMYVIKLVLQNRESFDIKARPLGASQAIRVVEALKRLGYISYVKYYTSTVVNDGKLERYIIINVKKTKDFQKLFDEREAERKRILESQKKLF